MGHSIDSTSRPGPKGGFLRWQWQRWREGLPKEPPGGYHFPVVEPDLTLLRTNGRRPAVTWIGHSTLLLQLHGCNILTDPQFSLRASPLSFIGPKRRVPPVPALDQLPAIHVVLISHNHYDHLDRASVLELAGQAGESPLFLVPRGNRHWFRRLGIERVEEWDWWESGVRCGIRFHAVPARHWSARGLSDRNRAGWCGWVLESPECRMMFAGDTGYSEVFTTIRSRLGPMDFAAIPIGHYEPRWFMQPSHVDPAEAVRIFLDLQATRAVAIHWGTFPLTDEPLDEPPRRLAEALSRAGIAPDRFRVLRRGETWMLPAEP